MKKILLAAFVIILSTVILSFAVNLPERKTIMATFTVSNSSNEIGFDSTPGILGFGIIPPNESSSKVVEIKNFGNQTVKVKIESSGNLAGNVIVSENNFILSAGESKNISFTAFSGPKIGRRFNGTISVITKKI